MEPLPDTFKALIKISGKLLFIIGLVVNICMLIFGFWPSFIYILIMLAGAGLVIINKDTNTSEFVDTETGWLKKSYNTIAAPFKQTDWQSLLKIVKNVLITLLTIFILIISAFVLAQDYFKKRDTANNCKQITAALKQYKQSRKEYPASLSELKNPLLPQLDQWGNVFRYRTENGGTHFILTSAGQDGKFNTGDDLVFKN